MAFDRDYEAKLKESQVYGDQATANEACSAPQAQGVSGSALGKAVVVNDGVPLGWQLREQMHALGSKHQRTARALDILTRHPEFEEFLELQQLISSGIRR